MRRFEKRKGQLILEILFTVAVAATVVGVGGGILYASLVGNQIATEKNIALNILAEGLDAVKAISFEKWLNLYNPPDNKNGTPLKGVNNCNPPSGDITRCYYVYKTDPTNASYLDNRNNASVWNPTFTSVCGSGDLRAVSASSLRNIWVVGTNGIACKWDGENWASYTQSGVSFNGVGTVSLSEIWLVGDAGKVYKFDGLSVVDKSTSSGLSLGASNAVYAVSSPGSTASGQTVVWIVGGNGTNGFVRRTTDGSSWSSLSAPSFSANLYGVSGYTDVPNNNRATATVVGGNGLVYVYNGSSWSLKSGGWGNQTMRAVSMINLNDIWIAGSSGHVWRYNGSTWTQIPGVTGGGQVKWGSLDIKSMTAFTDDLVYLTGTNGEVWRCTSACTNTENWSQIDPTGKWGTGVTINGVSDKFSTDVWFVGDSNTVWQYTPAKWKLGSISGANNKITVNGTDFYRWIYIQNVCRDSSGNITSVTTSGGDAETCNGADVFSPTTLKVGVVVTWKGNKISEADFITRWRNLVCYQNSWNGPVQSEPADATNTNVLTCPTNKYASVTLDTATGSGFSLVLRDSSLTLVSSETQQGTLTSPVFDTTMLPYKGPSTEKRGALFRSMMWLGTLNQNGGGAAANNVKLAIAVSDCPNGATNSPICTSSPGTWTYVDRNGTAGMENNTTPSSPILFNNSSSYFINKRYFRYKITLCYRQGCGTKTTETGPTVTSVVINWAP